MGNFTFIFDPFHFPLSAGPPLARKFRVSESPAHFFCSFAKVISLGVISPLDGGFASIRDVPVTEPVTVTPCIYRPERLISIAVQLVQLAWGARGREFKSRRPDQ